MAIVNPDHIACFECVQIVHPFVKGGVEHVACSYCAYSAPVEDALDDCFVFMVASAIAGRLPSSQRRTYKFMPVQGTRAIAIKDRAAMLQSGRALRAA